VTPEGGGAVAAKIAQFVALAIAAPAILWGGFAVWSTLNPPICGDAIGGIGLGVMASWVFDLPAGLLALGIGIGVKSGTPLLRRLCLSAAAITLCLPIIATALLQRLHCP
jgi:hypothetical protein